MRQFIAALCLLLGACASIDGTIGINAADATSSGYGQGIGASVALRGRTGTRFGYEAELRGSNERKVGATGGYTYGASGALRIFSRGMFLGAGAATYGYRSKFSDGAVWAKRAACPLLELGAIGDSGELSLRYLAPERTSGNDVSAFVLAAGVKLEQYGPLSIWLQPRVAFTRWTDNRGRQKSNDLNLGIAFRLGAAVSNGTQFKH